MKIKASIVVMSHLSDAQEELRIFGILKGKDKINMHINFAKFIILQYGGDLNEEIDADAVWERYLELNFV